MIVKTKYRDIPWEEARKCQSEFTGNSALSWERFRGQAVDILTPATDRHHLTVICGGPFYFRIPRDGAASIVCPHIAEIGD